MKRLYILCEGYTEEDFANKILGPYLQSFGVDYVEPFVCETKRTHKKKFKGGASTYGKIKKELLNICGQHPNEMVTTMFDLYGLPRDTPGLGNSPIDVYEKASYIEKAISDDINNRFGNLIFNLILHEYEGLLFSDVSAFESLATTEMIVVLRNIRSEFLTPEHINDSPETAPSKRIKKAFPEYEKTSDAVEIAEQIGIDKISGECRHFAKWITKLTDWAKDV